MPWLGLKRQLRRITSSSGSLHLTKLHLVGCSPRKHASLVAASVMGKKAGGTGQKGRIRLYRKVGWGSESFPEFCLVAKICLIFFEAPNNSLCPWGAKEEICTCRIIATLGRRNTEGETMSLASLLFTDAPAKQELSRLSCLVLLNYYPIHYEYCACGSGYLVSCSTS